MKKAMKIKCPCCKKEYIIKEIEDEEVLDITRFRVEVNCDCGEKFFVDYNKVQIIKKKREMI